MKPLRLCLGVFAILLVGCAGSRWPEAERRIREINAAYRINEPAPRQDAAQVTPWAEVEPICQARRTKKGDKITAQVRAELARIRGSGPGARTARERIETEGRLRTAREMLWEWRACLWEYGWMLVPRGAGETFEP